MPVAEVHIVLKGKMLLRKDHLFPSNDICLWKGLQMWNDYTFK